MSSGYRRAGSVTIDMRLLAVMIAAILGGTVACGDADGNIYLPFNLDELEQESDAPTDTSLPVSDSESEEAATNTDSEVSSDDCREVPWGNSCKTGNQIYNLTFDGIEAATEREMAVSFEALRCMGYSSAVIVAGDESCTACPAWYRTVGDAIDELHAANAVLIAVSTAGFGLTDITNQEALEETATMHPDYAVGYDPFVFPCRYGFTPFTIAVNLKTAAILGQDTSTIKFQLSSILSLVNEANGSMEN